MVPFLMFTLLIVGAIAWLIWRARHCSSFGCGVQELKS